MLRREFIGFVGVAATVGPRVISAQQTARMRHIGVLIGGTSSDPPIVTGLNAFKTSLKELGWLEGQNIKIDYYFAGADVERMHALAKQMVANQPDLIVGHTTPVVAALQRETSAIPIIFVIVSDPVGSGFVASLPHPGGNITGFINIEASLSGKWIEMLKEIVPGITRVGLVFNPDTAPYFEFCQRPFEVAARFDGIEPVAAPVHSADEIERVFEMFGNRPDSGLVLMPDVFSVKKANIARITSLAVRHRLPTIYPYKFMVAAGGLISYGIDSIDLWSRMPTYIDRVLRGSKPADLPVQLPTKFEMAINLKTARELGMVIPATMLGRADKAIE